MKYYFVVKTISDDSNYAEIVYMTKDKEKAMQRAKALAETALKYNKDCELEELNSAWGGGYYIYNKSWACDFQIHEYNYKEE